MDDNFSNSNSSPNVSPSAKYASIAPYYEKLAAKALLSLRKNIRTFIQYHKHKRIIDICCGTGKLLEMLSDNDMELTGIDTPEAMFTAITKNNSIRLMRKNPAEMEFPDKSFDAAILSFALHGKTEFERAIILRKSWSLTKEDGHLIIADYCSNPLGAKGLFWARLVIPLLELVSGKKHFQNYKNWMNNGALEAYIEDLSAHEEVIAYHFYGTVLVCAVKKESRSKKIFEAINTLQG